MATASMALQVHSQQEMESAIQGYVAQGFNIASRTPTSVTMVKRKEFSVLWAVIGFLVCLLPLLIYLIVYAAQSDQMVTITLAGAQPAAAYGTPAIASPASYSGYGASQPLASNAGYGASQPASSAGYQLSPDGQYFWDGQQWRPVSQLPAQTGPLPGQSGPLPGQSGPLYGQSGPLPDQSAAGYQQPQQPDPSADYYAQQQPQQPDPNQGQPGQSGSLYGQGQGGGSYPTYPGSGSGGQ